MGDAGPEDMEGVDNGEDPTNTMFSTTTTTHIAGIPRGNSMFSGQNRQIPKSNGLKENSPSEVVSDHMDEDDTGGDTNKESSAASITDLTDEDSNLNSTATPKKFKSLDFSKMTVSQFISEVKLSAPFQARTGHFPIVITSNSIIDKAKLQKALSMAGSKGFRFDLEHDVHFRLNSNKERMPYIHFAFAFDIPDAMKTESTETTLSFPSNEAFEDALIMTFHHIPSLRWGYSPIFGDKPMPFTPLATIHGTTTMLKTHCPTVLATIAEVFTKSPKFSLPTDIFEIRTHPIQGTAGKHVLILGSRLPLALRDPLKKLMLTAIPPGSDTSLSLKLDGKVFILDHARRLPSTQLPQQTPIQRAYTAGMKGTLCRLAALKELTTSAALASAMTKAIGCQVHVIDMAQQFSGEWSALLEITDIAICQSMHLYDLPTYVLSASLDALKARHKGKPPFLDCPPPPVSSDIADCFHMRRTIMRFYPATAKSFTVLAVTNKGLLDTLLTVKPSGTPTKVPPPSTRRSNNKILTHGPSSTYAGAVTNSYTTGATAPSNRATSLDTGDQLRLAQLETQFTSLEGKLDSILAKMSSSPATVSAHPAATTEGEGTNPQLTQLEAKVLAIETKLTTVDSAALPPAHLKRIEALESHITNLDKAITNDAKNIRLQLNCEAVLSKERSEKTEQRLSTIPTLADIMDALRQNHQAQGAASPSTPPHSNSKRGAREYHHTPESAKRAVPVHQSDSPTALAAMEEAMYCDHQASREHDPRYPMSAQSTTASHDDETTPPSHHA